MTAQAREAQGGGTWGPREAAADWRRGVAARVQAFGPATEMMLDLVKVAEGSRVLDVGAGAGDSTLVAAQRVGSSGRVIATDISASMLEITAESARQAGLRNVDTRVMDAQRLDLEPDAFDAAVSRNCLMLIPDYQRALTEILRVLKPGGRFAAIVFSTPDRCPYLDPPRDRVACGPPRGACAGAIRRVSARRSWPARGRLPNGWIPGNIRPHGSHAAAFSIPRRSHAVREGASSAARADGEAQPRRARAGLG